MKASREKERELEVRGILVVPLRRPLKIYPVILSRGVNK